nr:hypothetical protein [Gemmatimonadota bacterium]NIR77642.1 hypothetical protein [Gemmatimonadota bacterium]NIT86183.1 hypothetical protein [Gemmatimonadota bacterium]NIU30007.1 hypothetical protein [Gemmatimonadota bacterium]NIU34973.1 hypothetical protein [Gemmatimonadota bacterium]
MAATLEGEIRDLRARFWSERDPEGRVFAPLADACRRAGDLDEASRLVSEGTERLPGYAPGHLVAARVARDRGEAQIATRAYRRVLNLDPENVEALRELAALAESEGWDPVAADLLHRIYLLEPDDGALRERLRAVKRRCLAEELEAVPGTPGEARELTGAAPEPPSAPAEPESAVPESPVPGPPAPEPAAPEAEPAVPEAAAEG